ncbi:AAA family ATPase [uncultured Muribaculum sp.]|uniref:AAA family ATPase n=3 Tax=Muribaculum TaxID=1918540 RepID=UPI0025AF39B4|nr:AAA family ATPase [uncultured Muribaculum sp.]
MKCPKCNGTNRDIAKFCMWCGEPVATGKASYNEKSILENLVDKKEIAAELAQLTAKARAAARAGQRMPMSFVITGDVGTGKNFVAQTIAELLGNAQIARSSKPHIVAALDFNRFVSNIEENVERMKNTVIIIDDAHKLVPDYKSNSICPLDYIIEPIGRWNGMANKPIVIILGNKKLDSYLCEHPETAAVIGHKFSLPNISLDGMTKIALLKLRLEYKRELNGPAAEKLRRIFANDLRSPADALGVQGHNAAKRASQINLAALAAGIMAVPVGPSLVRGKEFEIKSITEIMAEFDKYVGVNDVKSAIKSIANSINQAKAKGTEFKLTDHYQFLGNPGTGKTTMARLFAQALNALGVLPSGQLVEVSRTDLVAVYVGETAKQVTKKFDEAMGGILFIDEAYSLVTSKNDSFGQEAVNTLLHLAENRRGKLVVILAGYTKEMGDFMRTNSGLASRFNHIVNFRDYTGPELAEIFKRMASQSQQGYRLAEGMDNDILAFFEKMYLTRPRDFGNAREVRNAYTAACQRVTDRMALNPKSDPYITISDLDPDYTKQSATNIDDALSKLDGFIGMESVKKQLRSLANKIKIDRMRAQRGGRMVQPNVHIVITGNPGTGKTEVAKLLGSILKAIGYLPKGHVVERERKTLLDSYSNSAGQNMEKAVNEAMGGVLFIDEAYNLVPGDTPGSKDKDGTAAIEALMTRMTNDAGKFVTVIAGYKEPIEEFIANANPGLARRFTYRIDIPDYTTGQLVDIFLLKCAKESLTLTDNAKKRLFEKVSQMVRMKDKNFGNAGEMVKLLDIVKSRQGDRLSESDLSKITDNELNTITASDIPFEESKKINLDECMQQLDNLVGLNSVKEAIRELADTLVIEQQRGNTQGLKPDHYLFLGNPGTGKTTVARILGNIMHTLGLLPSAKVVEVVKTDLVAPYVGQTAPKTRQMIDRAIGGVLFIDEAYTLDDGQFGTQDCMPELLTKLIDYKGRMVCVAAGYPHEMQNWLNSNSGLSSRFTRVINFDDYSAAELAQIFRNKAAKENIRLSAEADHAMLDHFIRLTSQKAPNFANAREAANYFDRVKLNQGRRLRQAMQSPGFDREELYIFKQQDMILA